MTDTAPILVVFGIDPEGKPRASRFAERDAELAAKAAALLGFRLARITDEAGRAIAGALPTGNMFARGNGFVRLLWQRQGRRARRQGSTFHAGQFLPRDPRLCVGCVTFRKRRGYR